MWARRGTRNQGKLGFLGRDFEYDFAEFKSIFLPFTSKKNDVVALKLRYERYFNALDTLSSGKKPQTAIPVLYHKRQPCIPLGFNAISLNDKKLQALLKVIKENVGKIYGQAGSTQSLNKQRMEIFLKYLLLYINNSKHGFIALQDTLKALEEAVQKEREVGKTTNGQQDDPLTQLVSHTQALMFLLSSEQMLAELRQAAVAVESLNDRAEEGKNTKDNDKDDDKELINNVIKEIENLIKNKSSTMDFKNIKKALKKLDSRIITLCEEPALAKAWENFYFAAKAIHIAMFVLGGLGMVVGIGLAVTGVGLLPGSIVFMGGMGLMASAAYAKMGYGLFQVPKEIREEKQINSLNNFSDKAEHFKDLAKTYQKCDTSLKLTN